jgi:hypothetical protein
MKSASWQQIAREYQAKTSRWRITRRRTRNSRARLLSMNQESIAMSWDGRHRSSPAIPAPENIICTNEATLSFVYLMCINHEIS